MPQLNIFSIPEWRLMGKCCHLLLIEAVKFGINVGLNVSLDISAEFHHNCYNVLVFCVFYIYPFENGCIMSWQCPPVRLSISPSVLVFWAFFLHVWRYQFETWYIQLVGSTTDQVQVSCQSGQFDLLYSQK